MNIQNPSVLKQLENLEKSVCNLLKISYTLGQNFIITNAMKGWVEFSAHQWMPEVLQYLEKITIISARNEYEEKFPGDFHQWKIEAFLEMTKNFDTDTITNLVCLGDSHIEMDAGHTLVKQYANACIKTIKFRENPNPEELVKQLQLVAEKFESICTSGKNLTIRLERKQKH